MHNIMVKLIINFQDKVKINNKNFYLSYWQSSNLQNRGKKFQNRSTIATVGLKLKTIKVNSP